MPAAPSQTGIVNDAAARCGSTERIQSIDGGSTLAKAAKAVWDGVVRSTLADHPWNFALRRVQLNAGPTPAFGFDFSYALPADCLRWLPPAREDGCNYFVGVLEDDAILTDAEAPLPVRYISSEPLDDWSHWPAPFVEAVTKAMAEALAEPLTASQSVGDRATEKAQAALKKAKRRDGLESGNRSASQVTAKSNWLQARFRPYNPFGR